MEDLHLHYYCLTILQKKKGSSNLKMLVKYIAIFAVVFVCFTSFAHAFVASFAVCEAACLTGAHGTLFAISSATGCAPLYRIACLMEAGTVLTTQCTGLCAALLLSPLP